MSASAQPTRAGAEPFTTTLAGRAIVAGIIGGVLIDLFLVVAQIVPFPGVYQFIASGLVGKVAFTSPSYIWLGVVMHFAISVVWALLYAFAANAVHALRKWLLGGLLFGIVVTFGMQIVESIFNLAQPLTVAGVLGTLFSHVVFFGWPIAWYLSRPYRVRSA